MWKRPLSVKAAILSIACFFLFFWHERFDTDGLHMRAHVPPAWETKAAFNVGLPFSPWMFYKTDESQPIHRRFSGIKVYPLSASWLLPLMALIATLWDNLRAPTSKPQPGKELHTDL